MSVWEGGGGGVTALCSTLSGAQSKEIHFQTGGCN